MGRSVGGQNQLVGSRSVTDLSISAVKKSISHLIEQLFFPTDHFTHAYFRMLMKKYPVSKHFVQRIFIPCEQPFGVKNKFRTI